MKFFKLEFKKNPKTARSVTPASTQATQVISQLEPEPVETLKVDTSELIPEDSEEACESVRSEGDSGIKVEYSTKQQSDCQMFFELERMGSNLGCIKFFYQLNSLRTRSFGETRIGFE